MSASTGTRVAVNTRSPLWISGSRDTTLASCSELWLMRARYGRVCQPFQTDLRSHHEVRDADDGRAAVLLRPAGLDSAARRALRGGDRALEGAVLRRHRARLPGRRAGVARPPGHHRHPGRAPVRAALRPRGLLSLPLRGLVRDGPARRLEEGGPRRHGDAARGAPAAARQPDALPGRRQPDFLRPDPGRLGAGGGEGRNRRHPRFCPAPTRRTSPTADPTCTSRTPPARHGNRGCAR